MPFGCYINMYIINMIRLTILVLFISCSADPRSPRIYNVLISSKKNLSPSHAQPVYEPVLRTTSLGFLFPSLYYDSRFIQNIPGTYINQDYSNYNKKTGTTVVTHVNQVQVEIPEFAQNIKTPGLQNTKSLNQQPLELTPQVLPRFSQPTGYSDQYKQPVDQHQTIFPPQQSTIEEKEDPKTVVANLKRNNGIPDVPPPPLPVRITKQR